jgi:hypothetical protein
VHMHDHILSLLQLVPCTYVMCSSQNKQPVTLTFFFFLVVCGIQELETVESDMRSQERNEEDNPSGDSGYFSIQGPPGSPVYGGGYDSPT